MDIQFLTSLPLFGGISESKINKITPLLKEHHYLKGDNIIKEGETGNELYIIFQGEVDIIKKNPLNNQEEHNIASLKKGDNFGEMELIDIQARVATVRAKCDTTVFSLSNHDLYSINEWDKSTFTLIIMNLAREISRRLRVMDNLVANLKLTINSNQITD